MVNAEIRWLSGKESGRRSGDQSLSQEDPLEEEMVTHSSILAWEILWKQSLVGYSPWGHRGVRHDLVTEQQGKYYSLNWIFPTFLPVMPSDARQGCFGYVNLLGFFLPPGIS